MNLPQSTSRTDWARVLRDIEEDAPIPFDDEERAEGLYDPNNEAEVEFFRNATVIYPDGSTRKAARACDGRGFAPSVAGCAFATLRVRCNIRRIGAADGRGQTSDYSDADVAEDSSRFLLSGASQFGDLVLHFRHDYGRKHDARQYRFLQAGYSTRYKDMASRFPDRNGLPLFSEWQVEVFPVPRFLRHRVQQYILNNALAEIRMWLDKRISTRLTGSETLVFFYDEDTEEFASRVDSRLQPDRV